MCYLVVLEGQFGTSYQLWYEDKGSFIGCSGQEPVTKLELPDPWEWCGTENWTIFDAVEYYRSLQ